MPVIVTYKVPFNTPWCLWMSKGNCVARKLQYQYSGVKKTVGHQLQRVFGS